MGLIRALLREQEKQFRNRNLKYLKVVDRFRYLIIRIFANFVSHPRMTAEKSLTRKEIHTRIAFSADHEIFIFKHLLDQ